MASSAYPAAAMVVSSPPSLVVVDVQNDYFDPRNGIGTMYKAFCVPGVRSMIREGRRLGWNIVHVVTEHTGPESLPRRVRNLRKSSVYCKLGTAGAETIVGLKSPRDLVVAKQGFSGFDRTALIDAVAPSEELVLVGVATDCCLMATAFDAGTTHGKRVIVPIGAVSASRKDGFIFGLDAMSKSVAEIVTLKTLATLTVPDLSAVASMPREQIRMEAERWYDAMAAKADEADYAKALEEGVGAAVGALEKRLGEGE
jgi:nicotinamidase-related amidase